MPEGIGPDESDQALRTLYVAEKVAWLAASLAVPLGMNTRGAKQNPLCCQAGSQAKPGAHHWLIYWPLVVVRFLSDTKPNRRNFV